jgi:hypothetical protein
MVAEGTAAQLAAAEKRAERAEVAASFAIQALDARWVTPEMKETVDEFLEAGREAYEAAWRRQELAEARAAAAEKERDEARARVMELEEVLVRGFNCPECGGELDNIVVVHRHATGPCTETLTGPDVSEYGGAALTASAAEKKP